VHVNGLKYPTQTCKREEMRWSKLWLGEEVRRGEGGMKKVRDRVSNFEYRRRGGGVVVLCRRASTQSPSASADSKHISTLLVPSTTAIVADTICPPLYHSSAECLMGAGARIPGLACHPVECNRSINHAISHPSSTFTFVELIGPIVAAVTAEVSLSTSSPSPST